MKCLIGHKNWLSALRFAYALQDKRQIAECLEKIEELGSECISDSANIEKHFEKFKKYIFNNANLLGKMSPEDYSFVRKLIRTVKSLMSACKKITSKKSRSEALRKFCDRTELDDNVQSIQNITKKISEKSSNNSVNSDNSETSLQNSVKTETNFKTNLEEVKEVRKVEKVSENLSNNSEKSSNNSETNSFNYVQCISTNLSENITGFT